jgi:hypothetical protein
MSHPHKALEEMGMHIPSSVKIHVRNEEAGSWELVIRQPEPNVASMSQDELREASGGTQGFSEDVSACPGNCDRY